ncbi:MAG: carbohydrate kinase family protein [bacterium]|nr:carbohydrate kinase family protein [bacterium]
MYDVITIGTATRDVFLKSRYFKEFRNENLKDIGIFGGVAECFVWGGKIEVEKPVLTSGGGATNAAVTFARQGYKTASIFKIGDDRPGEGIVQDLKKEGVTTLAMKDKKFGTGYSTLLLADTGERTVLVYRGAANNLELKEIPKGKLNCRWAYIVPGNIDFKVMENMVSALHKNGARIAIDLSSHYLSMGRKKLEPILKKLTLVKGNREEIGLLMGMDSIDEQKLFYEFNRSIGGIAVMSDGPRGVLVSDGVYLYKAGTYKEKQVADRTGAGDAFGSGFVAGLMRNAKSYKLKAASWAPADIEYAIRLGSANATSVVEYVGAKEGILTKKQFNSNRWGKLSIERKKL